MTQPKLEVNTTVYEIYVKSNEVFDFLEQYHGHVEVHPDYLLSEEDKAESGCWDDWIDFDGGIFAKDYTGDIWDGCILMLIDEETYDTIHEELRTGQHKLVSHLNA